MAYNELTKVGGRPFKGPLLVTQGEKDPIIPHESTAAAVAKTAKADPQGSIDYHLLEGISHVPVLPAALQIWLQWIEDRFEGKAAEKGLRKHEPKPVRPESARQAEANWIIDLQRYSWQVQ